MAEKNYSSIYNIEDYIIKNIMPLYLNSDEINTLNIGLQGQVTHILSDSTEDLSNMIAAVYTEMTPNTAILPATIYSNAALYRIEDIFAVPSELNILFLIREEELISNSTVIDNSTKMIIDKNTVINVSGMPFMFDNDVVINMKRYKGEMKYIVQYNNKYTNSLSNDLVSPYLQTMKFSTEEGIYLGIYAKVRQVTKSIYEENIINNQSINYPKINIKFNDYLANFEVFYKAHESDEYIQLKKVLKNSAPLEEPFCFYTLENSDEIEISFASRERYFTPDFNSDIKIEYYTCLGEEGNFETFTGDLSQVSITMQTDTYRNNGNLVTLAIPQNGATGGINALSFEELKNKVVLKFSTTGTIITENDLQLYFSDINSMKDIKMLFKKKRDDIYRLFTAFSYYNNRNNVILHTHTLDADINLEYLTRVTDDAISDIIKPGTIFEYKNTMDPDNNVIEISHNQDINSFTKGRTSTDFVFTNPFLINIMHEPNNIVGVYLNSINSYIPMSYTYNNIDAYNQFICTSFHVYRNALFGEDSYEFKIVVTSSSGLTIDILDKLGNFLGNMKTKLIFMDGSVDVGYIDLDFESYEKKIGSITFSGRLTTDDCLTLTEKIRCINIKDIQTSEPITRVIPYSGTKCKVAIFCKSKVPQDHKYAYLEDLKDFELSNIYTTMENKLNLVIPFSCIRTYMEYTPSNNIYGYNVHLTEVPLVSAYDLRSETNFEDLINLLSKQYQYFTETVPKLENSYSIDLKFMGTYGKSKMFTTELGDKLDRLNCKVEFNIYPYAGVDLDILREKLNMIISDFFDGINITGDRNIKISNLMQQLDSVDEVDYLKFVKINDYDSNVQVLINNTPDITTSGYNTTEELNFIPEYVTIRQEDIILNIIE